MLPSHHIARELSHQRVAARRAEAERRCLIRTAVAPAPSTACELRTERRGSWRLVRRVATVFRLAA